MGGRELRTLELWAPRSSAEALDWRCPPQVPSLLHDTEATRHTVPLSVAVVAGAALAHSPLSGVQRAPLEIPASAPPALLGQTPHYFWKFVLMVTIWGKKKKGKK